MSPSPSGPGGSGPDSWGSGDSGSGASGPDIGQRDRDHRNTGQRNTAQRNIGSRGQSSDSESPGEGAEQDFPPEGFKLNRGRGPFTTHNGPFYLKMTDDGPIQGFRVQRRHCNGHGIVHGGMLMAFADGVLAMAVYLESRMRSVTIRMNTDFLSMARPGDWVEGVAQVTAREGMVSFVQGRIYTKDRDVLTARGVFKLMASRD